MLNRLRPIQANFSITFQCNHHCFYCSRKEDQSQLSEVDVVKVVEKLVDGGILLVMLTGGEVFCREDFFSILERVRETGVLFHVETNGTLIQEKEAQRLARFDTLMRVLLCLDGTPSVHDAIHEKIGAFQETIRGINCLKSVGIPVECHTLLCQKNVNILDDLIEITHNLNVKRHTLLPLVGHSAFQIHPEQYRAVSLKIKQLRSKYPDFDIFMKKNEKGNGMMPSPLYINPLGYAAPCPYGEGCFVGNVLEEDIDHVLSSLTAYYSTVCQKKCKRWEE